MKNWKCMAADGCFPSERFLFWGYAVLLWQYDFHLVHFPHHFQLLMLHLTIRQHVMQSDIYSTKLKRQTEINFAEKASTKCTSLTVAQSSPAKSWYHPHEVNFQKLLLKWHYSFPTEHVASTAKSTCVSTPRSPMALLLSLSFRNRSLKREDSCFCKWNTDEIPTNNTNKRLTPSAEKDFRFSIPLHCLC